MDIKLGKIIDTAYKLRQAEHDANEGLKVGNYRAGQTGLYIQEENKLYGQCARKLLLRSKNITVEEISQDRKIMFSGGVMNEQILLEDLKLGSDYLIKTEEEIPTKWYTKTLGTLVTGRPDIVLCDYETENPLLGLELKMVSSLWTARDVACKQKPKFNHLCQAAHYMWQLEVPFKLVYTSYVDYQIPLWASGPSHFPAPDEPGSEFIEYGFYKKVNYQAIDTKTGKEVIKTKQVEISKEAFDKLGGFFRIAKAKKTLPFTQIYDLKWSNNGTLLYKREKDLTYERTFITLEGIKDYFELLDKTREREELPPRPVNVDIDGNKASWSMCDSKYCTLADVCDKKTTLDDWLNEIKLNKNLTRKE